MLLNKRKSPSLKKHLNVLDRKYLNERISLIVNIHFYFKEKTFIGLCKYTNGAFANVRLTHGIIPGNFIKTTKIPSYFYKNYNLGDTILLKWALPLMIISNIFIFDKNKTIYSRAAGVFSTVIYVDHEKNYSKIRLTSGYDIYLYNYNFITLGQNSNVESKSRIIGKAGSNILRGFRPSVRGVAMNPVDHPHGGRTKTNSPQKTPWGFIAKKNK